MLFSLKSFLLSVLQPSLEPLHAMCLQAALEANLSAAIQSSGPVQGELMTEVVEEFISIADGQV